MNEAEFLTGLLRNAPSGIRNWVRDRLPDIGSAFDPARNGHLQTWREALARIPPPPAGPRPLLDDSVVADGTSDVLAADLFRPFHPWRKGPYRLGGVKIDTEWRSDLKWNRLLPALEPLAGRACLDVGCGNGYHLWRMRGAGALPAVGLDPYLLYVFQFLAVHRRIPLDGLCVLPLPAESLTSGLNFDTAFSMGVLYHVREPSTHLRLLHDALRPEGQLVLETLTLPEGHGPALHPAGRYAKMRNVHLLPAVDTLLRWIRDAGFRHPVHVDTTRTTPAEQRSTPWMTFHSLPDFLDPDDPTRTIEGLPAPRRTVITATRG